jgi:hypothetical protein
MANKYYLIPQELYKGLTQVEPQNINLDFEKKEVQKMKKVPKKDRTARNTLYNQELGRYLKIKHEQDNKPVKVELTNGAQLITKKAPQQTQTSRTSSPTTSVPSSTRTSDIFGNIQNRNRTPSLSTISADEGLLFGAEDDDEENGTYATRQAPSGSRRSHPFPKTYRLTDNPYFDPLYNIITANPQKYNVTNIGKILNNQNRPIGNSNIHQSLNRILSPKLGEGTPPGTTYLKAALKRDSFANNLLEKGLAHSWKDRYTPAQSTPQRKITKTKFKPELWN